MTIQDFKDAISALNKELSRISDECAKLKAASDLSKDEEAAVLADIKAAADKAKAIVVPAVGDTENPTAPTGLAAQAKSSSQIDLTWTVPTDNVGVTGYRVERSSSSSDFAIIAKPTQPSLSDTGLTNGTAYSYRVNAVDAAGNVGPYSNVATASTLFVNPFGV